MKEIISLNGRTFEVNGFSEPMTDKQRNYVSNQILSQIAGASEIHKSSSGCSSCGGGNGSQMILLGTANCPTTSVTQNSSISLSASLSQQGTAPYTWAWTISRPGGGSDTFNTQNPGTYTLTQTGRYTINLTVSDSCSTGSKTDSASCSVDVVAATTPICQWITNAGGATGLSIPEIMTLVDAYMGIGNVGFTPTQQQIMGCVDYYLGFTSSGNTKTGCSF